MTSHILLQILYKMSSQIDTPTAITTTVSRDGELMLFEFVWGNKVVRARIDCRGDRTSVVGDSCGLRLHDDFFRAVQDARRSGVPFSVTERVASSEVLALGCRVGRQVQLQAVATPSNTVTFPA